MEVSAYATLPDTVRGRIVALTAGVLPDVVRLPPALKRIADFAPARRAKAGGAMIASVLETDDEVREKVGSQLRPAYVSEGSGEDVTLPEDPAEAAAVVWLVRPDGWEVSLKEALDRLDAAAVPVVDAEVARLRGKLAAAEDEIREVRADRKARLDELKADNTALRRKLGEARAAAREAGTGLDEARAPRDYNSPWRSPAPRRSSPHVTASCASSAARSTSWSARRPPSGVRRRRIARTPRCGPASCSTPCSTRPGGLPPRSSRCPPGHRHPGRAGRGRAGLRGRRRGRRRHQQRPPRAVPGDAQGPADRGRLQRLQGPVARLRARCPAAAAAARDRPDRGPHRRRDDRRLRRPLRIRTSHRRAPSRRQGHLLPRGCHRRRRHPRPRRRRARRPCRPRRHRRRRDHQGRTPRRRPHRPALLALSPPRL
ncbi:LOW QUALITY PROTEIN: PE-PGRS family protein, partial [Nocardioidaceae bacterium Broad-1]